MIKKLISFLSITAVLFSCSKNLQSNSVSIEQKNNVVEEIAKNPNELTRLVVSFDTNSSKIDSNKAKQIKNEVKNIISNNKNYKITLIAEGHCDERGSEKYNYKLGKSRAHAVKKILVSGGVKPGKIAVSSQGESKPIDLGHDENAWSKNRRVELIIFK